MLVAGLALFALARPARFLHSCRPSYHTSYYEIVAGAWLFLSPWILGERSIGAAAWLAWIIGILLVVLATWKVVEFRREPVHVPAF